MRLRRVPFFLYSRFVVCHWFHNELVSKAKRPLAYIEYCNKALLRVDEYLPEPVDFLK